MTVVVQGTSLNQFAETDYYHGLPTNPLLVARSTTPSVQPTDQEAYPVYKELRVVGEHALSSGVWEDKLAPPLLAVLESEGVLWTSVDVVRIGDAEEFSTPAPVILWIGVMPQSLTPADGLTVALKCKKYLEQEGITDVHVELRESIVSRWAGPRFLDPPRTPEPTVEACRPLTSTLGLSICAASTAWTEGTGGFFIAEGGDSKRIFLVTARHVVFPPDVFDNDRYEHIDTNQPRHNVLLLGGGAFKRFLESIQLAIGGVGLMIEHLKRCIKAVEGKEGKDFEREREDTRAELVKQERAMERHVTLHRDALVHWSTSENRVLGHVVFSPPISFGLGIGRYTEDFSIIEMDTSKFDANNFQGNAIDLGTLIGPGAFTRMMDPHPTNDNSFTYPHDRLLRLKGVVSIQEMRHPTTLDENGDPCMMVLKRGITTGLTTGRANNIASFVRYYSDGKEPETSVEWPIFSRNSHSGRFSSEGDSGALIVNGLGQMFALLTGGAGVRADSDITYGTPIEFLQQRIIQQFPQAHFDPVLA
jgi:hypothetical protein